MPLIHRNEDAPGSAGPQAITQIAPQIGTLAQEPPDRATSPPFRLCPVGGAGNRIEPASALPR